MCKSLLILMARICVSGKLCARKLARTVWEGGNGKGLGKYLAGALLHSEEGGGKRAARVVPRQPPILPMISDEQSDNLPHQLLIY